MEDVLTFGYGVLTCIAVFGIVYGVIQLRLIKENSETAVDDVDDCKASLFTLRREYEEKVDVVYNLIKDLDGKLETLYKESIGAVNERFDEIDEELDELNKNK
jgi:uncharacterized membrane-anchored protein YhcB (DUF1043 family)